LKECAADAAAVQIAVLSGRKTAAQGKRENKQIQAQVRTIASIGAGRAAKLFWDAVDTAVDAVLASALP
jgi:hypothetical protein